MHIVLEDDDDDDDDWVQLKTDINVKQLLQLTSDVLSNEN